MVPIYHESWYWSLGKDFFLPLPWTPEVQSAHCIRTSKNVSIGKNAIDRYDGIRMCCRKRFRPCLLQYCLQHDCYAVSSGSISSCRHFSIRSSACPWLKVEGSHKLITLPCKVVSILQVIKDVCICLWGRTKRNWDKWILEYLQWTHMSV